MVQSKIGLILKEGQPVIKVTCIDSEEIVDTVFKMFREKFGQTSTICQVQFVDKNYPGEKVLFISPVAPDYLAETCSKILEAQPRAGKPNPFGGMKWDEALEKAKELKDKGELSTDGIGGALADHLG